MSKKAVFLKSLTAAAIASTIVVGTSSNASAKTKFEKCYGVVKAAKNDCGANGHSCAAMAATDNDANEWVLMPKGLCDRITGGSTTPGN